MTLATLNSYYNSCISQVQHSYTAVKDNCNSTIQSTQKFVEDHKKALFVFSTLITLYYSLPTALIGGLIGYVAKGMMSNKQPVQSNDNDSEQQREVAPASQEPIITNKKAVIVTLGAVGSIFPIPAASLLMILAGAFTIGSVARSINDYYYPQNSQN